MTRYRLTTAQAAVVVAVITALGTFIAGTLQSLMTQRAAVELERQKFETTLILKAIETPSEDERVRNLKFFLAAGFIRDPESRIRDMPISDYPSLPGMTENLIPFESAAFSAFSKPLLDLLVKFEGTGGDPTALHRAVEDVRALVQHKLNVNQEAALVSLVYNIGVRQFRESALLQKLNSGEFNQLEEEFLALARLPVLKKRRMAELELFRSP